RTSYRSDHLLRHSLPRLGKRHQQEHQWPHSTVPPKANINEARHTRALQRDREHTQQPAKETTRLPNPRRAAPPLPRQVMINRQVLHFELEPRPLSRKRPAKCDRETKRRNAITAAIRPHEIAAAEPNHAKPTTAAMAMSTDET